MNIFSQFKGIVTGKQGGSGRSVLHNVNDYLISLVNREDMIAPILERNRAANRFGFRDNQAELIRIYFLLENFIVKHKPIIVKKEYSKEALRTYIRETWVKDQTPELEKLIFGTQQDRVFRMYRIVIREFVKYAQQSLGFISLTKFFESELKFRDIVKYNDNNIEFTDSSNQGLYKEFFASLYKLVADALGEKYAEGQIRKMFEWCRSIFDFEIVSLFFEIIPENVLPGERLSVLNRDELELKIVERTEELRLAKEKVEEKIKERTAELENEKLKLSIVTENMAEGAIVLDEEMNVVFINTSARRYIGIDEIKKVSTKEVNLQVFTAFVDKFTQYPLIETLSQARGKPVSVPEVQSGDKFFKLNFNINEGSGGRLDYYLVWIEDITEVKALERRKSEFVSIAAHQLRTPLSAMKWAMHMIMSGDLGTLNADQSEMMSKAYNSNDRMIDLVNDLLSTDRIDSGKIKYEFAHVDLSAIFETLYQELTDYAKLKGINCVFDKDKEYLSKQKIYADVEKVRAVFQNLIDNSIKYSKVGQTVEVKFDNPDKLHVRIRVIDNGIGIPAADQKNIFTRFFRAPNAQKMEANGSGLGLYIAKNILESHGGSIKFTSAEHAGTTFEIEFPLDTLSDTMRRSVIGQ